MHTAQLRSILLYPAQLISVLLYPAPAEFCTGIFCTTKFCASAHSQLISVLLYPAKSLCYAGGEYLVRKSSLYLFWVHLYPHTARIFWPSYYSSFHHGNERRKPVVDETKSRDFSSLCFLFLPKPHRFEKYLGLFFRMLKIEDYPALWIHPGGGGGQIQYSSISRFEAGVVP